MRRLNALTFKQLRALRTVAETRSISRAAGLLSLTPPAVHSQIKALEENFGCRMLFRDGPDAFAATPEGEALLIAFDKAEAGLKLAIHRIEALRKGFAGTVVLGVVSTAKYFAPTLVAIIRKELPDIEVVMKVGNRGSIVSALTDRAVDLAIMGRPPREPEVVAHPIGDNPHVLIAPPGHRLTTRGTISADDLLAETFIAREPGSGTRILAERFLHNLDSDLPADLFEAGSNETIKQSVIAGLGIGLISRHTVVEELRAGRLVTIDAPGLPIVRRWFLLYPSDQPPHGAVERVHDLIATHAEAVFQAMME